MENKENQELLDCLSEQHQQLLHLQDCQRMLLNTQREFSQLGLTAEEEISKKYNILQSVKHRITQLENMAMDSKEKTNLVHYDKKKNVKQNDKIETEDKIDSMNDQLSDLHGLVSTLLTEVDDMIDQNDSLQETSKRHDENIEYTNQQTMALLSPLPQVNLVDRSTHMDLSGSYNAESFGNVERHVKTPVQTPEQLQSPNMSWDLENLQISEDRPSLSRSKTLLSDSTQISFLSETERSDHYNYTVLDDMLSELNNSIGILRSLLIDQKSLRSLLRNSMNRNQDSEFLDCSYGISSDFIKYQLDSCTQQVTVYQNHIGMLQKQFAELKLNTFPFSPDDSLLKEMKKNNEDNDDSKLDVTVETDLLDESENFQNENNCFLYPVYTYSVVSNKDLRRAFPPSDAEMPLLQIKKLFYECHNKEDQEYLDMISQRNLKEVLHSVGITLSAYLEFICESESKMSYSTLMSTFPFLKDRFTEAHPTDPKNKKLKQSDSFFDEIVNESGDSPRKCDPLFESLREDIYSQAAGLIFQNESRPHFLMELFHELKQLNSDYLRQHCLYVLRDTIRGFLQHSVNEPSTSNIKQEQLSPQKRQSFLDETSEMFTENTPSECDASDLDDSEEDIPFVSQMGGSHSHHLYCDYSLDVSNGTELSTPLELSSVANEEEENPFETDYLGSTVLHLDEALQRVREIEKEEQDKIDASLLRRIQEVVCGDKGKKSNEKFSTKKMPQNEKNNIKFLDTFVKRIMSKMVTKHILNSPDFHLSEENAIGMVKTLLELISQERMMDYIDYIHLKTSKFKDAAMFNKISKYFVKELRSEIEKCLMEEFVGQSFADCGEKIVVKLADILYQQFSFYCLEGDVKQIHFKNFTSVGSILGDNINESFQEKLAQASIRDEEDRNTEELSDQEEQDEDEEEDKESSKMGDYSTETVILVVESKEDVNQDEEKIKELDNNEESNKVEDQDKKEEEVEEESVDEEEENDGKSLVVDLSASETKPLTSYGSGEDEEGGSGDEFLYNEVEEVSTSMQQDHNAVGDSGAIKNEVKCN